MNHTERCDWLQKTTILAIGAAARVGHGVRAGPRARKADLTRGGKRARQSGPPREPSARV